jgi:hypothetical protein
MPLTQAFRVAPPTELWALSELEQATGRRSYPWIERGEEKIRITVDHSGSVARVTQVHVIGGPLEQPAIEELRMYWPEPDEVLEETHVRQYVWYDFACGVQAIVTLVSNHIVIALEKIESAGRTLEGPSPDEGSQEQGGKMAPRMDLSSLDAAMLPPFAVYSRSENATRG